MSNTSQHLVLIGTERDRLVVPAHPRSASSPEEIDRKFEMQRCMWGQVSFMGFRVGAAESVSVPTFTRKGPASGI